MSRRPHVSKTYGAKPGRRTPYGTSNAQWILDSPEPSSSWSSPSASVLARDPKDQAHRGRNDDREPQTVSEVTCDTLPEPSMASIPANDVHIDPCKPRRKSNSLEGPTQRDENWGNQEEASRLAVCKENTNQLKTYGARKHNQKHRANRELAREKQEPENIVQNVSNVRLASSKPSNDHSRRHRKKEGGGMISRDEVEDSAIATQTSSYNTVLPKPTAPIPRVVIPVISNLKSHFGADISPKQKVNSHPNPESLLPHSHLLQQGGQRKVRGRISLATSSARRNRWHKSSTRASVAITSAVSPLHPTSDQDTGSEWEPDEESEVENRPPLDIFPDRNLSPSSRPDRARQHRKPVLHFDATSNLPQPRAVRKRVNHAVIQSDSRSEDEPAPASLNPRALASHQKYTVPKNPVTEDPLQPRVTRKTANRRSPIVIQSGSDSDETRPIIFKSKSIPTETDSQPEGAPCSRRSRAASAQQDHAELKVASTKTRSRRRIQATDKVREKAPDPLPTKEPSSEASEEEDSIEIVSSQNKVAAVISQLSTPKGYPLKSRQAAKPFRQNHSPLPQPYANPPMAISPVMKIHGIPVALAPPPVRRIRGRLSLATSSARRAQARTFSTHAPATFVSISPDVTRGFPGVYGSTRPDPPGFEVDPSPHKPGQKTLAPPALYASPRRPGIYLTPVKMNNRSMSDGHQVCSTYLHHPSPAKRPGASRIVQELSSLLQTCEQSIIYEFTSIFNKPPATIFKNLSRYRPLTDGSWRKIAEATFSEVYSWSPEECSDSADMGSKAHEAFVMKVVPIKRSTYHSQRRHATKTADQNYDGRVGIEADEFPCETEWVDVEKEIKLARLLGSETEKGFLNFRGAFIVSGAYPPILLKEWKSYQQRFPEKVYNPSPGKFSRRQLYCCMLSGRAGEDLESFDLRNWQEAASVLSQVAHTLSRAERNHEFEHRDLHWGNITVQRHKSAPETTAPTEASGRASNGDTSTDELVNLMAKAEIKSSTQETLSSAKANISVTLLDFGLSRARLHIDESRSHVIWTEPDPDIFGGTAEAADYQFECYDLMNAARKDKCWRDYNSFSNVIWLHYLARKLLEEKGLSPPRSSVKNSSDLNLQQTCFKLLQAAERILSDAVKAEVESHRRRAARFLTKRNVSNPSTNQDSIKSAESFTDWWDLECTNLLD
ncbi:hypothetical protein DFH28DRAFT_1186021 [Melampsora americana]|nr:hypothetical protein DFH28DRAFT_1186021 [Melampsora americana]